MTLTYESLYASESRYMRTVLDVIDFKREHLNSTATSAPGTLGNLRSKNCLLKGRPLKIMDGEVMPTYLHMYDKVTVKRIASDPKLPSALRWLGVTAAAALCKFQS